MWGPRTALQGSFKRHFLEHYSENVGDSREKFDKRWGDGSQNGVGITLEGPFVVPVPPPKVSSG